MVANTLVYRLCKAKMTFFKDLGIPGPKPHPIYGNLPELFEIGVLKATEGWASKYGDIVGYFDGFRPVMIVRDTQLLKQIFIRNFDSFNARLRVVELTSVKSVNNEKISRLSGDKWRMMRALTSPAFKSSMLKRAFPIIEKCTDEFLEIMEEKVTPEQECVQIDQPFFRLSMEILLRYTMGARLNLQAASRETEPFVNSVREALERSPYNWIMIFNVFPLWYCIKRLTVFVRECLHVPATTRVHQHIAELVRLRRAEGQGNINYDNIFSLKYLNQVIEESLRFYPPLPGFVSRRCQKDFEFNGLRIPKGTNIQVPARLMHHDPRYWVDPEKFNPDRFSPENKPTIVPMAYIPFGIGPRSCPGSRLAETELPLIMAKTVAKFKLHLSDQPEKSTIKYVAPAILAFPDGGTWLKMEKI
ncbi:lithocholate 6-beta-hydroxylase-like [Ixodes scapularis]